MNLVDVLVLLLVAWTALRGAYRGFVTHAFVVVSIVAGLVVGYATHDALLAWWGRGGDFILLALRVLVAVVAGVLAFTLLQLLAERFGQRVNESVLGPLNRAGGLALGLASGSALAALALLLLVSAPFPRPVVGAVQRSWSGPRLFTAGERVARAIVPLPGSRWLAGQFRSASRPRRAADAPAG